jgi:hypothetical protein
VYIPRNCGALGRDLLVRLRLVDFYYMKIIARPNYLRGLGFSSCHLLKRTSRIKWRLFGWGGKSGPGTRHGAAGRGRPPQAAARRAGLESVEKLLTTKLRSADMTGRNASMLHLAPRLVIVVELATGSGSSSP